MVRILIELVIAFCILSLVSNLTQNGRCVALAFFCLLYFDSRTSKIWE